MRTANLYAHWNERRGWCHASQRRRVSQLLWENDPVLQIIVQEDPAGEYWAWWDNNKQTFDYLSRTIHMVRICFPYGPEAEQARGRGELLRVSVTLQTEEREEAAEEA